MTNPPARLGSADGDSLDRPVGSAGSDRPRAPSSSLNRQNRQTGTLVWARPLVRVAAAALVLLGVSGVVAGYFLPWSRFDPAGGHYPPVALRSAIAVLGPGLTALAVALRPLWLRRVAALGAFAVAAFGVLQLITITTRQGYGAGGPVTILGALALAGGWLAGGPPLRPRERAGIERVPGLVVLVGTAVLVGFAGWGAQHWFTEGRFVDASTAPAPDSRSAAAPAGLEHQRWQRTLTGEQLVGLAAGQLVVRDRHGVRALDAATGRQRWHYERSDLTAVTAAVTADGRGLLLFYGQGRGVLGVSLDPATGGQRWVRQFNATPAAPWNVGTLAPVAGAVAAAELGGAFPARLVAADSPEPVRAVPHLPVGCTVTALAGAGDTLAVALHCAGTDTVVGVSARTGRQLWSWQPPYPAGVTVIEPLALTGTGTGLLVEYGERGRSSDDGPVAVAAPRAAVLLDPASGTAGPAWRATGSLLAAGGTSAVYLDGAAVGVDLGTGTVQWSTPLTALAGYHPVAGAVSGGTGYLVFRGAADSGRVNGDGGPLGVVALHLADGQPAATRMLPADLASCRPGSDGRTLCGQRPVAIAVGAGAVFLAEQRDTQLALTALD